MQEEYDVAFWDIMYDEFGMQDELDVLSESVENIIYPVEGIIIFITKDFYNGQK